MGPADTEAQPDSLQEQASNPYNYLHVVNLANHVRMKKTKYVSSKATGYLQFGHINTRSIVPLLENSTID